MRTAILGWGSLLWDKCPPFDKQHKEWKYDGPTLKLEFSRVSSSRDGVLTLVLDLDHGEACQVAYTFSKRSDPEDAICDLRRRERTTRCNIGVYFRDGSCQRSRDSESLKTIQTWASKKEIDVVVWTDLESNFQKKPSMGPPFSVERALKYLQALCPEARADAIKYIKCAPDFVDTPLRRCLKSKSWFNDS